MIRIVIVDDQFHADFGMTGGAEMDVTVVDDEVVQPSSSHEGALVSNHVRTSTPDPDDSLMVADEQNIIIDDLEILDVDFVMTDADVVPDMTAKPARQMLDASVSGTPRLPSGLASSEAQTGLSLAQMDALPTTAKALIYG